MLRGVNYLMSLGRDLDPPLHTDGVLKFICLQLLWNTLQSSPAQLLDDEKEDTPSEQLRTVVRNHQIVNL